MPEPIRKTGRARVLRHRQTDAERKLWALLRDRRLAGAKFRRQHPVGRYITDFACPKLKLVIELDGGQHLRKAEQDRYRSKKLAQYGYRVIRFWDSEMLKDPESVLKAILDAVESPSPPPSGTAGLRSSTRSREREPDPLSGLGAGEG